MRKIVGMSLLEFLSKQNMITDHHVGLWNTYVTKSVTFSIDCRTVKS